MTEPVESTATASTDAESTAGESSAVESSAMESSAVESSAQAEQAPPPADLAAVLTAAVDQARAALVEFSGEETVGEYLGSGFEDPTSATHRFLAKMPGYQGWQWAVVVAAYPGADHATVSEVVLIPGPTALLAPSWVPWEERVKPGDLSPGDLLAPPSDDPRLVPGYLGSGDPELDEIAAEVGFGRRQVLSLWGRASAAERWHDGEFGPASAMARATKRVCRDCGFYLPLAGSLGPMFGVCGNEMAADGHVVDSEYGCGAHSDTPAPAGGGSPLYDPFDDGVLDVAQAPPPPVATPETAAEVPAEEPAAEAVVLDAEAPATEVTDEVPAAEVVEAEVTEAEAAEVDVPEAEAPRVEVPVTDEPATDEPGPGGSSD